jgi:hypothetical protein
MRQKKRQRQAEFLHRRPRGPTAYVLRDAPAQHASWIGAPLIVIRSATQRSLPSGCPPVAAPSVALHLLLLLLLCFKEFLHYSGVQVAREYGYGEGEYNYKTQSRRLGRWLRRFRSKTVENWKDQKQEVDMKRRLAESPDILDTHAPAGDRTWPPSKKACR